MNTSYEVKEIQERFDFFVSEIKSVYGLIKKNEKSAVMSRLFYSFWFVEICSSIHNNYKPNTLTTGDSMKLWLDEYCLNHKNEEYRSNLDIQSLTSEYLYALRCSVVHNFSFPEEKSHYPKIAILNGDPEIETTDLKFKQKILNFKKLGVKVIDVDKIFLLFLSGGLSLIADINLKNGTDEHSRGINRIYEEFCSRRSLKKISLSL